LSAPAPTPPPAEHHEGSVPLPAPLKQKIKDALVAWSLANMCFVGAWFSLLYDKDYGFFNSMPVAWPSLLALATNIGWLALLIWLGIRAWRRFPNPVTQFILHCLFLLLLLIPFVFLRNCGWFHTSLNLSPPQKQFAALVIAAFALWQHRRLAKVAAVTVAILSPMAFAVMSKIIMLCLGVMHLQQAEREPALAATLFPPRDGAPRVIWIVFDETDYRLVFEQRPGGLNLPEFDRLRNESLSATNAYPPGNATIFSMPGLISGQLPIQTTLTNSTDLAVNMGHGEIVKWSQLPSVFAGARKLSFNTALVGWYLPYRRVLGQDLNYCSWYSNPTFQPSRAKTFGAALLREIATCTGKLHICADFARLHRATMKDSLSVATNTIYGLTLLHLVPPHGPFIYRPETKQFTVKAVLGAPGYFNELQLADRSLGELRHAIEAAGQWDKTWIILSSDHSWRISGDPGIYDGRRDYRVPFLVKPPHAGGSLTYSRQFNTVVTHDLILAILRSEVTNLQTTAGWLDAHDVQALPVVNSNQTL
jgi:hypothetical protein